MSPGSNKNFIDFLRTVFDVFLIALERLITHVDFEGINGQHQRHENKAVVS